MTRAEHRLRSPILRALWATARSDRVFQMAAAWFAALALAYLLPVLPADQRARLMESDVPDVVFFALVLLAFELGPRVAESTAEKRFWRLLSSAFACWLAAVLFKLATGWARTEAPGTTLAVEALYALYFASFVLAVEVKPHLPARPDAGLLSRLAGAVFVCGLFVYFVLIPILLNFEAYEAAFPSAYLYLVVDVWLTGRFLDFYREARTLRWRALYATFTLTGVLLAAGDFQFSFLYASGFQESWGALSALSWNLQFVALIAAARLRRRPSVAEPPPAVAGAPAPFEEPNDRTLVVSLALPLLHFLLYSTGRLDEAVRPAREAAMFVWVASMGVVAFVQHRLLERSHRHLEASRAALWSDIDWRQQLDRERRRFLTELEAANAELEAKNAELERFTYTISHDLKSPLITLRGFLRLLRRDSAAGNQERVAHSVERIRSAARGMVHLLDDLLELSRVGRVVAARHAVEMAEVAADAVDRVAGMAADRRVAIEVRGELPAVDGDRPRLIEVLQNLLENAIKYMGEQTGPRVEVGARTQGRESVFYVRDNGRGIEPEDQQKIFRLFQRLDPAIEGTGVGLALVKRIVEAHGGRVWVESEGRSRGSTFCFTLPASRVPDPSSTVR